MAKRYFNDYIKRLDESYKTARRAYTEMAQELSKLEEENRVNNSAGMQRKLSAEGRQMLSQDYLARRWEIMRKLEGVQMDFERTSRELRGEVERSFNKLYDADESRVDLRAVEIIKSGILSDSELKRMAERYKAEGNNTMYRLACSGAKGRTDNDMKALAAHANSPVPRRDLELYDSLASAYNMALRPREIKASNAIDARLHDMAYEQTLQMGADIMVEDGIEG